MLAEQIASLPGRIEHLEQLEHLDAPEAVRSSCRSLVHAIYELRDPDPAAEHPPAEGDFRELFETCIELAVRDPWAANVGYGPFLEYFDPPRPGGLMLVDTSWVVHFENADDGPPCVYGFDGFDITIPLGLDRDELAAFEPDDQLVDELAADLVADELEAAGEDLDGEPLDDDEDPYLGPRRRVTLELAPDRVAFEVRRVRADWDRAKARLLAALDDVRADRCAMLCWSAKNPAL